MSWWRISRKWLRARVRALDHHLRGDLGRQLRPASSAVVYHQIASLMNASRCSGSTRSGSGRKPESASSSCSVGRVALGDRALAGELELHRLGVQALEQAEVQERHAAVVEQQEVAGVRVAGELAVAVQAAEEEAEDDLADAVALGLRARP